MTPFEALCAVAKTKPKPGEDFPTFARRLTNKINDLNDPEWQSLGDGSAAQLWHNTAIIAFDQRKAAKSAAKDSGEAEEAVNAIEIPELEGFEPVPAKEDEKVEAKEETVDPETGEVTEEVAKPKKEKKEKAVKKAKPEKAAKPAKAAKPEKKVVVKKAKTESRGRRSLFEDTDKVKVKIKKNPHREGSTRFKNYEKLLHDKTVAENVENGVSRQQIWSMLNRELITVG